MDKSRLIEEVRKRPLLWNSLLKNRLPKSLADSWEEVASSLGDNVTPKDCKYVWKMLRTFYRNIYLGLKDPIKKWRYYEPMHFLKKVFIHQYPNLIDNENSLADSEISIDNVTEEDYDEESKRETRSQSSKRIIRSSQYASTSSVSKSGKQNPQFITTNDGCINVELELEIEHESYTTDDEEKEIRKPTKRPRLINNNSVEANSCNGKSIENRNIQKHIAEETLNVSITKKDYNKLHSISLSRDINDSDHYLLLSFSEHLKSMSQLQNLKFRTKISELILSILTTSLSDEKLETLVNTTQAKTLVKVDDLDSNFLISFWPYMKLMSQLQNLQFRCKISDIMLNILAKHGN